VNNQGDQIKILEDEINRLLILLNNLLHSNVLTGICPNGIDRRSVWSRVVLRYTHGEATDGSGCHQV